MLNQRLGGREFGGCNGRRRSAKSSDAASWRESGCGVKEAEEADDWLDELAHLEGKLLLFFNYL